MIRQQGAIGVQAHTHSAMATCPISSEFREGAKVLCAPGSNYDNRRIQPGTGIYLDSSAGGYEVRRYEPCNNGNTSDCRHFYDYISSAGYHRGGSATAIKSAGSGFGAMFVTFNQDRDASKARVYYKNVEGETVFSFNIRRDVANTAPQGGFTGGQYKKEQNGRVLQRVSETLACKPDVLSSVVTDPAKYAELEADYDRDLCANVGNNPPTTTPPTTTPTRPSPVGFTGGQYRAIRDGRVLQRVSSDLACKPKVLSGVLTDPGIYADLERHYDRDRCAGL